ncbi:MAG TPA: hypothetical protein VK995_00080, partial [Oceanipulchritudo sp.]|nr:hypothetical protein [Oceanipulchritudo sp.]
MIHLPSITRATPYFTLAVLACSPLAGLEIQLLGVSEANEVLLNPAFGDERLAAAGVNLIQSQPLSATFAETGGSIRIAAPESGWDWSQFVAVSVDIRNAGEKAVTLIGDLDGSTSAVGFLHLSPGAEDSLVLYLMRKNPTEGTPFTDMNGVPGGRMRHWDVPKQIQRLQIADLDGQAVGGTIEILASRGIGRFGASPIETEQSFFPFVDEYGQYKHQEWP